MIDTAMMQISRTRRSVYPEVGRWLPLLVAMLALGWMQPVKAQTAGSPDRGTITKVGTTAAQFIKLGVGARAIGMGGTFVAEASDLSALYWNPAGLGRGALGAGLCPWRDRLGQPERLDIRRPGHRAG